MNTKAWIGFFAGAIAASVGSYYVSHRQPASSPAAVVASAVQVTDPEPAPVTHAKRTVKKKAEPVTAAIDPDPGPAPFASDPEPQAAPQPAPQEVAAAAPPPARAPDPPPPPVEKVPEPPHTVTIAAGTLVSVRLNDKLTTQKNQTGDVFSATLDQPLVVDGFVIAERGARVDGRVVQAEQAGRVKGVALLSLELTRIAHRGRTEDRSSHRDLREKGPEERRKKMRPRSAPAQCWAQSSARWPAEARERGSVRERAEPQAPEP